MSSSIASSSRATMAASSIASSSRVKLASSSLVRSTQQRRTYASRSAAEAVTVSLTFLNKTVRFTLPELPTPFSSPPSPPSPQLALAGDDVYGSESAPAAPATSLLEDLWDGVLRAVPKSKVSHSRKAMRSANKGLKDRTDLVHCASCGRPKLAHHICAVCYGEVSRIQKAVTKAQRQQQAGGGGGNSSTSG
ncbi:hypothetical protein FA10DRAFT_255212 [Acaromyces ingoldii]|uniref:Large ribosomal subunit protein bL32m n=1 Tax=Acaromyces ingoldii TaxID=215250 RepID=A0A316YEX1_9BASI|nr:hypothetical protein FA10DRAFT_255212 [Acaromyces ingoldii]PWN87661.1 hypothetical protein FA10DRAFT_255212 [Acaromyces ingoldii]